MEKIAKTVYVVTETVYDGDYIGADLCSGPNAVGVFYKWDDAQYFMRKHGTQVVEGAEAYHYTDADGEVHVFSASEASLR